MSIKINILDNATCEVEVSNGMDNFTKTIDLRDLGDLFTAADTLNTGILPKYCRYFGTKGDRDFLMVEFPSIRHDLYYTFSSSNQAMSFIAGLRGALLNPNWDIFTSCPGTTITTVSGNLTTSSLNISSLDELRDFLENDTNISNQRYNMHVRGAVIPYIQMYITVLRTGEGYRPRSARISVTPSPIATLNDRVALYPYGNAYSGNDICWGNSSGVLGNVFQGVHYTDMLYGILLDSNNNLDLSFRVNMDPNLFPSGINLSELNECTHLLCAIDEIAKAPLGMGRFLEYHKTPNDIIRTIML